MKRLRHPIRAIREPFGTAGLIVAMIALVAALGGTALAAAKLNSTQKKEVEKIAKKFSGKPGAPGAAGAAGSVGKEGAKGSGGSNGSNGSPGSNGTSVTASSFTGAKTVGTVHCEEGGVEVKSASPATAVCNGSAASGGGTLPSGKTETGVWQDKVWIEGQVGFAPISFPIPLELGLDEHHVVYLDQEENEHPSMRTTEIEVSSGVMKTVGELCEGNASAPEAAAGFLCVYTGVQFGELEPSGFGAVLNPAKPINTGEAVGASSTGAVVALSSSGTGGGYGTWAVTAP